MKKEIQDKKIDLYKKSVELRNMGAIWNLSYEKSEEIRKKQTELYNKCMFFKGLSNAMDKIKEV